MISIKRDLTQSKEKWYAVTDKGIIWGGSCEIVERKIKKINAKEKYQGLEEKQNE